MKKIKVLAIPEKLRLAVWRDDENDIKACERMEDERLAAFKGVFDDIMAGVATVAYWDDVKTRSDGTKTIQRKILHRSTRCDGLQLSFLHIVGGENIPMSHQTFEKWDARRFWREHGYIDSDYTICIF